jgi:hypothetical protein
VLPELPGGGHAVEVRLPMEQQRELGAGDLDAGGVLLPDEPLAVSSLAPA